jgi:glutamate:GABA antiporter
MMYFLLMLAAIYLRYKKPEVVRAFKIPFKNLGMWVVSTVGMSIMIFSFIIAVIPPQQLPTEKLSTYMFILLGSIFVIFVIPFLIHRFKNPKWEKYSINED